MSQMAEVMIVGLFQDKKNDFINRARQRIFEAQDAEDVVMTAFVKAIHYKDSFKVGEDVESWFYTILNNCIRDYRTQFLADKAGTSHENCEEFIEEEFATNDPDVDWSTYELVLKEIETRTGDTNAILTLYFQENYTPADIAKVVGSKSTVVRSIIHRFKSEMREKYAN